MTSVGLVTIATGRYVDFLPTLVASASEFVVGLEKVFILTDREEILGLENVELLRWDHMPWPFPTLLRYRAFSTYAERLSRVDVLLYSDADMRFVGEVDVRTASGLIAVRHPGYIGEHVRNLPYERRRSSAAYIKVDEGDNYFCGGIQGGLSSSYLRAAAELDRRIAQDQTAGVTAIWHDESHWNRYLIDNPPSLALGPEYCRPDTESDGAAKILAITKDHAHYRELKGLRYLLFVVHKARGRAATLLKQLREHTP